MQNSETNPPITVQIDQDSYHLLEFILMNKKSTCESLARVKDIAIMHTGRDYNMDYDDRQHLVDITNLIDHIDKVESFSLLKQLPTIEEALAEPKKKQNNSPEKTDTNV